MNKHEQFAIVYSLYINKIAKLTLAKKSVKQKELEVQELRNSAIILALPKKKIGVIFIV